MTDFRNTGTAWKTRSGALVRLREGISEHNAGEFDWYCEGCTDTLTAYSRVSKDRASREAQEHAAACTAIQA